MFFLFILMATVAPTDSDAATNACAVSHPPRLRKAGRGWETESQRGGGVVVAATNACAVSHPPRLRKAGRGWETESQRGGGVVVACAVSFPTLPLGGAGEETESQRRDGGGISELISDMVMLSSPEKAVWLFRRATYRRRSERGDIT